VQLTAANGDDEVDELLAALTMLAHRSLLQASASDAPTRRELAG
jgi:hypothetical protein